MLFTAKTFLLLSSLAGTAVHAASIANRQENVAIQLLEIGQAELRENERVDGESATGINLRWYSVYGQSALLPRCDNGHYDCGAVLDQTNYHPQMVLQCEQQNAGNSDTWWCQAESHCCYSGRYMEDTGCRRIGVDPNNRIEWCRDTANFYSGF